MICITTIISLQYYCMFIMTSLLFLRHQAFAEQPIHLRDPSVGHNAKLMRAFTQILITDSTGLISAWDAKHEKEWQKGFFWGKFDFFFPQVFKNGILLCRKIKFFFKVIPFCSSSFFWKQPHENNAVMLWPTQCRKKF